MFEDSLDIFIPFKKKKYVSMRTNVIVENNNEETFLWNSRTKSKWKTVPWNIALIYVSTVSKQTLFCIKLKPKIIQKNHSLTVESFWMNECNILEMKTYFINVHCFLLS